MTRVCLVTVLTIVVIVFSDLLCPANATDSGSASSENILCSYDRDRMLSMDLHHFDQDDERGWRSLGAWPACYDVAADLIRAYRRKNGEKSRTLRFHEAQIRAHDGQYQEALELLPSTRNDEPEGFGWNQYVDATIAFLERDREALLQARTELSAIPQPEDANFVDPEGNPVDIDWPPNLGVVDRLVECFDRTYEVAYRFGC